ncbi:MAG: hypothetical protein AMXMBFR4_19780 [Candidatus Hydrogenedentota bacterium]
MTSPLSMVTSNRPLHLTAGIRALKLPLQARSRLPDLSTRMHPSAFRVKGVQRPKSRRHRTFQHYD